MSAELNNLATALQDAIESCPAEKRNALAQAIEDYDAKHRRALRRAMNISGITDTVMDVLIEASDCRLSWPEEAR